MAKITERETKQIDEANASGRPPAVFIHGLWLLPSSWERWATLFEEAGYAALTPSWPDDPETVDEARAKPQGVRQEDGGAGRRPAAGARSPTRRLRSSSDSSRDAVPRRARRPVRN